MILPISQVLPALQAALEAQNSAVLVAPPGAGKTTGVPLALLNAVWLNNRKIIVLSPRRLAARAAAARMAQMLGEAVGETVGYRVRLDSRISARTRIEVVTEGVLTRMLLDTPDLPDVGAILFDEIHERSLDGDVALALALDVQCALREDLRLLPMSATLDGARVSALLGDAPIIESQGRMFPVDTVYLGRDIRGYLDAQMASAVRQALAQQSGNILCFLPGMAEILRTADKLKDVNAEIHTLYGAMDVRDQQRAIEPPTPGVRKVVLATSIAETSLTIEGVRVVIDSGMARRPRYQPGSGMTQLVTERVSQASAEQRRGRAGRLEPGVCYRLWDEAEMRGLIPFDPPEILNADATDLVLTLAMWGTRDPDSLRWLDAPPRSSWNQAQKLLQDIGALDAANAITDHGKQLAKLPLHPRLAHAILRASTLGFGGVAANIAALIGEPGVGGKDVDISLRLERFMRESGPRAKALLSQSTRWAKLAGAQSVNGDISDAGKALALAYPERVARARGPRGHFLMASGRAAAVDETDALAKHAWLAIGEVTGTAERSRILSTAAIDEADVRSLFTAQIECSDIVKLDGPNGAVTARRVEKLGALILSDVQLAKPSAQQCEAALADHIRSKGLRVLPWNEQHQQWQARVMFAHAQAPDVWPDVSDARLAADVDWIAPYLAGKMRLADITPDDVQHGLEGLLGAQARHLNGFVPARLNTPAGSSHAIDYAAVGGPAVELRVQELFGLKQHPCVADGNVPLTLVLLSPGHRPIQTTKDLPGFWAGSWSAVKAEMKGRYPKHLWPDDPSVAVATTHAKPRGT
jgi:ATP-dependent helicase HrpB